MIATIVVLAGKAARRVSATTNNHILLQQRKQNLFVSKYDSTLCRFFGSNRPKPIKVKRGAARRRIEPKSKVYPNQNALVEQHAQETLPSLPMNSNYFASSQAPQTFGGMLKESFMFGIGMALAMTVVGVVFAMMEESPEPGQYEASIIIDRSISDKEGEELVC